MSLLTIRGEISKSQKLILGIAGVIVLVILWWVLAELFAVPKNIENADGTTTVATEKVYPILPPPNKVLASFKELVAKDELWGNTTRSIWLNIKGYFWAIFISIPIAFVIGLLPIFRSMFSKPIDALRYLPLTALTGLFIIWFGIEDQMKIAFLAFGILVYLLPVVVQRIGEVDDVYLKTVFTLGATDWQTVKTVFVPSVFSKLIDDIRVLTAISWTYIIIAELLNREGGIGSLIYIKARQGQIEKVFAILLVIVAIGFLQDRIFAYFDKRLFPHKYYSIAPEGIKETQYGIFTILAIITLKILQEIFAPQFSDTFSNIVGVVIAAAIIIILYGEFKLFKSRQNG
ncbi:MAG: ABC transporter permease subunit [Saprospiraceae bacterium]|nr:ABC transporter permease subunit [Saprospiraceae bacterium]MBP7699651.1 ABC transporter permease subunit [Saprospiraceae bacterium]